MWDKILSRGTKYHHMRSNVFMWDQMLSSGAYVILWYKILSSGAMLSFGANVIMVKLMLSCGTKCYHVGPKCYHLDLCYQVGRNVIMWDQILLCGAKCNHLELMLTCRWNAIMWGQVLSSTAYAIMWDEMLSSGTNVIIRIKCYHVEAYVVIWSLLCCKVPKNSWQNPRNIFKLSYLILSLQWLVTSDFTLHSLISHRWLQLSWPEAAENLLHISLKLLHGLADHNNVFQVDAGKTGQNPVYLLLEDISCVS